MIKLVQAIAVVVVLVGSMGSAMATDIVFGDLSQPAGCSFTAGDSGAVCDSPVVVNASGATFTVTGFNDPFDPAGGGALTFKATSSSPSSPPLPANSLGESGFGENATGPVSPCSDPDCEIGQPTGVSISVTGGLMDDVIIGSVQDPESFNLFTGPGQFFVGTFTLATCDHPAGFDDSCHITFDPTSVVWVQSNNVNVLLTAVSGTFGVPEPSTLALLGSALLGLGLFSRRKKA